MLVFYNYAEALLSRQGILIEAAYSKTFFTAGQALGPRPLKLAT
jgi:hypothetical protein